MADVVYCPNPDCQRFEEQRTYRWDITHCLDCGTRLHEELGDFDRDDEADERDHVRRDEGR